MAQITWQNIAMPNFGSDRESSRFEHSGSSITPVFDSLTQILKDRAALDEKNRANAVQNNNMTLAAQAAKIKDWATMTQGEKDGSLNPLSLVPEMGTMFTPGKLTEAIEGRKKVLEKEAINEVLPGARTVADKKASVLAGGDEIYNRMIDKNVPPEIADKHRRDYIRLNAADEAGYEKIKEGNLSTLDNQIADPTKFADIPALKAAFIAKSKELGLPIDEAKITALAEQTLKFGQADQQNKWAIEAHDRKKVTDGYADTAFNNQQTLFKRSDDTWKREENDRILGNKVNADAHKILATTGDETAALRTLSGSGLPQEMQDKIALSITQNAKIKGELRPNQKAEIDLLTRKEFAVTDAELKKDQKTIDTKRAAYQTATGMSDSLDKYIGTMTENGTPFIKSLAANSLKIGIAAQVFTTFNDGGLEAVETLDRKYNDILNIPELKGDTNAAQRIMVLAMQKTYPANLTFLGRNEGVNSAKLIENINTIAAQFIKNKDTALKIKAEEEALVKKQAENLEKAQFKRIAREQNYKKFNITGNDTKGEFEKNIDDIWKADNAAKAVDQRANASRVTDPTKGWAAESDSALPEYDVNNPGASMSQEEILKALARGTTLSPSMQSKLEALDKSELDQVLLKQQNSSGAPDDGKAVFAKYAFPDTNANSRILETDETALVKALKISGVTKGNTEITEAELRKKYPDATDTQLAELILKARYRTKN